MKNTFAKYRYTSGNSVARKRCTQRMRLSVRVDHRHSPISTPHITYRELPVAVYVAVKPDFDICEQTIQPQCSAFGLMHFITFSSSSFQVFSPYPSRAVQFQVHAVACPLLLASFSLSFSPAHHCSFVRLYGCVLPWCPAST